jgi:hypothetical protein
MDENQTKRPGPRLTADSSAYADILVEYVYLMVHDECILRNLSQVASLGYLLPAP